MWNFINTIGAPKKVLREPTKEKTCVNRAEKRKKCVRRVLQGILWQNGMSSVHCLVHSWLKNLTPLHIFMKIPNALPKILKRLRNKNNLKWTIMNRVQFTFFSKWYWYITILICKYQENGFKGTIDQNRLSLPIKLFNPLTSRRD